MSVNPENAISTPQRQTQGGAFGPHRIRGLRGDLSRAAFARKLGVTPNTIYRWELPEQAAEARRPRGSQLERLARLERGEVVVAAAREQTAPTNTILRGTEDLGETLPFVERIFHGEARRGQSQLVTLLATRRDLSANARAVAAFGVAVATMVLEADARGALLALSPALADAEAGLLEAQIAGRVFALSALVRSVPDAGLFDIGYVHAYAARAEALSGRGDPETLVFSLIATLAAAMLVGDRELLERGYVRFDEAPLSELSPLLDLHVQEFRGLRPLLAGKATTGTRTFDKLAERASALGYPILAARALGLQAQCDLDNLAPPESVLALTRRARQVLATSRSRAGLHHVFLSRAEGEALFRLGQAEASLAALGTLQNWSEETGVPPFAAVPTWIRVMHLTGRMEGLSWLAERLRDCDVSSLTPICRAYLAYLEAMETLATSDDTKLMVAAFARAETEAKRWPLLLRHVMQHQVLAHLVSSEEGATRMALRRAQRMMDIYPSPWLTAQLRRLEGSMLTVSGNWSEGRHLIESAIATFELAQDRSDTALARYILAVLAEAYGEPQAADQVSATHAELGQLGLKPPHSLAVGMEQLRNARARKPEPERARLGLGVEALVVPLQRLSVRGALPSLILRELVSIVEGLFRERSVRLEELDSTGTPRGAQGADVPAAGLSFAEFSDGAGRSFRIGVTGEVGVAERALLSVLATAASLSLEAATLRGYDERRAIVNADEQSPDIPGFLAASPAMRRLKAEIARLHGSSATVIITGESGVGKEVVARAIHDLSERAGKSYVAFNCATVPRDLFEGQLFGYRRGAFTGATSDHAGVIRAATGGTLFLDEIGELPLDIQPKLLRFLENGEILPLGERRPLRADVRVLAATHRNLNELVRERRFREDLYYRLQVVPIHVPPLRDRKEDVPLLARHFIRELTRRGEPPVLAPDAVAALMAHDFPGNVRELRNVIERAMAFSPTPSVLRAEHLRIEK